MNVRRGHLGVIGVLVMGMGLLGSIVPVAESYGQANPIWPKFRYDRPNTGKSPFFGPDVPGVNWAFGTTSPIVSSAAIGADGTSYMGNFGGDFFAINPDGTERWRFDIGGNSILSSPAIGDDGRIYFGADNGVLYVLDPNGMLLWTFQANGPIRSSPALNGDIVYFGTNSGSLYAVTEGSGGAGLELWRFQTNAGGFFSSPALQFLPETDVLIVYIGSTDGNLYAVDAASGMERWAFQTGASVQASPIAAESGRVYVGSTNGFFFCVEEGDEQWQTPLSGPIRSSAALDGSRLFVGTDGGSFYALNANSGGTLWEFILPNRPAIFSSPAVSDDGNVYFGADDGVLYAFNGSGAPLWSIMPGLSVADSLVSSPSLSYEPMGKRAGQAGANTLVISSYTGNVYAIGPRQQLAIESVTPSSIPTLDVGESVTYTITVVDLEGNPVRDAAIEVDDVLQNQIVVREGTNGAGQIMYTTTVPDGRADGIYTLTFVAQADNFDDSDPVMRQVEVRNREPRLTVRPSPVDYGLVPLGTRTPRSVTIGNEGQDRLTVEAVELQGADSGDFTLPNLNLPLTIDPEGSTSFNVTFSPQRRGSRSAELVVRSDADTMAVPLVGEGASPDIAVAPDSVEYGAVDVGAFANGSIAIANTGNAPLSLQSFTIIGADVGAFAVTGGGGQQVLDPGATHTVEVRFAPQRAGAHEAALEIENDATRDNGNAIGPVSITLLGDGATAALTAEPGAVDFGGVVLGASSEEQTVTLDNTGTTNLAIQMRVVGADAAAFAIVQGGGAGTLGPADPPRTVVLQFTPARVGVHTATLQVQWSGSETLIDLQGAGVTFALEPPQAGPAQAGEDVVVSVAVPDGFAPTARQLFFRQGGQRDYQQIDLQDAEGGLQGVIPGAMVTERGLEYFVRLADAGIVLTYPEASPALNPVRLRVRVAGLDAPGPFLPGVYRMVSAPYLVDDNTLRILIDDYGPPDPARWRIARWLALEEVYSDPGDGTGLRAMPGRAFWLITRDGQGFDLGEGTSVDTSEPYLITLLPGWNQIGNPFAFPVAVSQITRDGPPVQGPYFYDGAEYLPNRPVLVPWEGYFMLNTSTTDNVTLTVPPVESLAASKQAGADVLFPEADFVLQLHATVPGTSLRDTHNYIGFADASAAQPEVFNLAEPPPIGDHVRLSILDEDQRYLSRFIPPGGEGGQWDLEVEAVVQDEAHFSAKTVQVAFVAREPLPDGFERYVFDRDLGRVLTLEGGTLSVTLTAEHPVRRLSVVMGTAAFAEAHSDGASLVPVDYVLEANYPNPFNPQTVIRYGLSQHSAVDLAIYNVLGQRVRTLVAAEQPSGRYEAVWDGLDDAGQAVASGVYLYQLRAGSFQASRTMLLVR